MMTKALDDHIERTPGVAGGKPWIAGHRITVQNIAMWHERRPLGAGVVACGSRLGDPGGGIDIGRRNRLRRNDLWSSDVTGAALRVAQLRCLSAGGGWDRFWGCDELCKQVRRLAL